MRILCSVFIVLCFVAQGYAGVTYIRGGAFPTPAANNAFVTVDTTGATSTIAACAANQLLVGAGAGTAMTCSSSLNITSLVLPGEATDCSGTIAEGAVCWQKDTNVLYVGDAAAAAGVCMLGGTQTISGAKTFGAGIVISDSQTITFDESAANPNDADVVLSAADGVLTIGAANGENNENLTLDFDATANQVAVGTGTSVTLITSAIAFNVPVQTVVVDGSAHAHLTAANVSGTQISNYGQGAADVFLMLPTAAAGYSFIMSVGTAQAANHWCVEADASDKIYLVAAAGTIAGGDDGAAACFTVAEVGQSAVCYTIQTGASAYDWVCKAIAIGTSTFAAHASSD